MVVMTGIGSSCRAPVGTVLPGLSALLGCTNPVHLIGFCSLVNRCSPTVSVLSCLLPRRVADFEGLQGSLYIMFLKCFFWQPTGSSRLILFATCFFFSFLHFNGIHYYHHFYYYFTVVDFDVCLALFDFVYPFIGAGTRGLVVDTAGHRGGHPAGVGLLRQA